LPERNVIAACDYFGPDVVPDSPLARGAFAFARVLHNRHITAAIGGPRTEAQWEDYVAALAVRLGPDDEALVDRLVSPGHPSTPGYNDPQYPIEGRMTG
jgi:aryl-alcohol dehydrogenase-like predicted oxidoreductase